MSLDNENLQGQGMTSLRTRQRLIERLTEKGISDVRILEAMRDSPRHLFLDEALAHGHMKICPYQWLSADNISALHRS